MEVKETKEAILAVVAVGKFVVEKAKDGLDLNDLGALITKFVEDEQFKGVLMAGVDGIDKVPAELSDLEFAEVIELAEILPEILAIIKG